MAFALDTHFERQVIALCTEHGAYVTYTTGGVDLFIKRGNSDLHAEARNQAYIYELAQSDLDAHPGVPKVPKVPKVHHTFDDGCRSTYLVMAHIPALKFRAWVDETGLTVEERQLRLEIAKEKIAAAISWLLACPIPEDHKIGPVGGGRIQHDFFNKEEAPIEFFTAPRSGEASQQGWYQFNHSKIDSNTLKQALSRLPASTRPKVPLSHEELMLGPSDVSLDNFLYDPLIERVWMIDYQYVNVLPASFASFALHGSQDPFVQAVANKVNLTPSQHLAYLRRASGYILQCGNSSLGLDGYGNPKRVGRRNSERSPALVGSYIAAPNQDPIAIT